MLDFKPPNDSLLTIGLVKLLLPTIMKVGLHDTSIVVSADGMERFKALSDMRTIVCPNHANQDDPEVLFAFSQLVSEDFNFLAAREVFERDHGWRGFWLQRLGCYSVIRGACDRESFNMTKSLLCANEKKLVIFPEGEVSRQNDTLLHLEIGVPQMAFWSLDELARRGQTQSVFILPLALKYTFKTNIYDELERSLYKLEQRLGIVGNIANSLYARLNIVSESLLSALEHDYNYEPVAGQGRNDRIIGLRLAILKNMANYLAVELPEGHCHLEYVRILRNVLDDYIYDSLDENSTDYQRRLHDEKSEKVKGFYKDLDRVLNFIAIYDGYLRERLTQERFAEVIDRFEIEVFGKSSVKGGRLVYLEIGNPLDLLAAYKEYKSNRKAVLRRVTEELSQQISGMLEVIDRARSAIFVE